jgi:hypothetical protein
VFPPFSLAAGGGEPMYPPFKDQRGMQRFVCGKMDIGAVQTQAESPPIITLVGASVITNVCPTAFAEPGVMAVNTCGDALNTAAGGDHSLALQIDGTVAAWGKNANGQTDVPADLPPSTAVAGGGYHSLALTVAGNIVAWGGNENGQLNVPPGTANVIGISAGGYHSLALTDAGNVVAWGDDSSGQSSVPGGVSSVVAVAAGRYHSLALRDDGTVVAWGGGTTNAVPENGIDYGQSEVPAGLSNVVAIAAGGYHSLALRDDGTVVAWGAGTTNVSTFADLGQSRVPAGLSNVVAVAAGRYHSLALQADGTVVGWGSDQYGQSTVPVGVVNATTVVAGGHHSLAITADGAIYGWGLNTTGQASAPLWLNADLAASVAVRTNGVVNSVGTAVLTYSVWDENGNSNSVTRTVVTVDTQVPSITNCPANVTTVNDRGLCAARVYYATPAGTDACSGATTKQISGFPSGGLFPVGVTHNVFRVTDAGGNTAECSFDVTVVDTERPQVSCGNLLRTTAPGECQSAPVTYAPVASDNCAVATNVCVPASGSIFPKGTNPVQCAVLDTAGNTNLCAFTVTVVDQEGPTITCPTNIVADALGTAGVVVIFAAPTASDNCPGEIQMFVSPQSGSVFPVGKTTVSCVATDVSSNQTTCVFTVTVRGPESLLTDALDVVIGLNNAATDSSTIKKLTTAVKSLNVAVDPNYWPQSGLVSATQGSQVFNAVKKAVKQLQSQMKSKNNTIPVAVLQEQIGQMVKAIRVVTVNGINAAASAGATAKQIEQANAALAAGDTKALAGDPAGAISQYKNGWKKIAKVLAAP